METVTLEGLKMFVIAAIVISMILEFDFVAGFSITGAIWATIKAENLVILGAVIFLLAIRGMSKDQSREDITDKGKSILSGMDIIAGIAVLLAFIAIQCKAPGLIF